MDFELTDGFAVLERTPHTLRALLAGLPPAWTDATESPETWSIQRSAPSRFASCWPRGSRTTWPTWCRLAA